MIVIGMTGSIGSGKTTFASFLGQQVASSKHFESWLIVAEVANALRRQPMSPRSTALLAINAWLEPLPHIVAEVTGKTMPAEASIVTREKLSAHPEDFAKLLEYLEVVAKNPELADVPITELNKEQLRSILQWLGGYLVKYVDSGLWYDEIVRRIRLEPDVELATVGGVRYPADAQRLEAAGGIIIRIKRPAITSRDATDITERERDTIKVHSTILNDAGLKELARCAGHVVRAIEEHRLQDRYRASDYQH